MMPIRFAFYWPGGVNIVKISAVIFSDSHIAALNRDDEYKVAELKARIARIKGSRPLSYGGL